MRSVIASICVALLAASPLAAQIPDTVTNLQVLDETLGRDGVVNIMKAWTQQLGVRCAHCHVGPDNLQGMDFASDEKATKRTAREMFVMAQEINRTLRTLPVLEAENRKHPAHVKCFTCHRGLPKPPRPTGDLLAQTIAEESVDAALEQFETLRSEHADAGRYDLRRTPLFHLGRNLLNEERVDEAKSLIVAMLELFPDFADGHVLLGRAYLMEGDLDAAEAKIRDARAIEPENRFSKWWESQIEAARAKAAEGDPQP